MKTNYTDAAIRHDWQLLEIQDLFEMPFMDLLFLAQTIHRRFFDPNEVQYSRLLNIKTGACPEDCKYCSQSAFNDTSLEKQKLMPLEEVLAAARNAKENGASRFCMGAAWRSPPQKKMAEVCHMIQEVKAMGLETCVTLGMLSEENTQQLAEAGLDYYNHNLDTSPEYYPQITTTRTYQDRLDTLQRVRDSGIKVCCGGIMGMGESREDRVSFLQQLANLPEHPESVPINMLMSVAGTPLANREPLESFEFIRTIASARIMMPQSFVRLSAGRVKMNDEMQTLCFFAGANSIFIGDTLLTTPNPDSDIDLNLLQKLKIKPLDLSAFYAKKDEETPCSSC